MSFLCQQCNKPSKLRTRRNQIVIEKREREYYSIIIVHKTVKKEKYLQFERKDRAVLEKLEKAGWRIVAEKFSKGWETVKTKTLCEDCYRKWSKDNEKSEKCLLS